MEYHGYTQEEQQGFRDRPEDFLAMRKATESAIGAVFPGFITDSVTQKATQEYIRGQMIEKINHEELASKLIPDFLFGCRRITVRDCRFPC